MSGREVQFPNEFSHGREIESVRQRVTSLENRAARGKQSNINGAHEFYDSDNQLRMRVGYNGTDWDVERYTNSGILITKPFGTIIPSSSANDATTDGSSGQTWTYTDTPREHEVSWGATVEGELGFGGGVYVQIPRTGPYALSLVMAFTQSDSSAASHTWARLKKRYQVKNQSGNAWNIKVLGTQILAAHALANHFYNVSVNRYMTAGDQVFATFENANQVWGLLEGEDNSYLSLAYLGAD